LKSAPYGSDRRTAAPTPITVPTTTSNTIPGGASTAFQPRRMPRRN
jgi:hypothetical protein